MDLSVILETGQNFSVEPPKKGRIRDALRRFTKKQKTATVSIQTDTEMPSEPVTDVSIVEVIPPKSRIPVKIGQGLLTCVRFMMDILGVIGGIYAILRILNVNNDTCEI